MISASLTRNGDRITQSRWDYIIEMWLRNRDWITQWRPDYAIETGLGVNNAVCTFVPPTTFIHIRNVLNKSIINKWTIWINCESKYTLLFKSMNDTLKNVRFITYSEISLLACLWSMTKDYFMQLIITMWYEHELTKFNTRCASIFVLFLVGVTCRLDIYSKA